MDSTTTATTAGSLERRWFLRRRRALEYPRKIERRTLEYPRKIGRTGRVPQEDRKMGPEEKKGLGIPQEERKKGPWSTPGR